MNLLAGCRVIETLREDNKTGIYRGLREGEDGSTQSVVIKTLRAPYPLLEDIAQLYHEFEIARTLPLPGVVQPVALVNHNNSVALLLEDFGGVSLDDYLESQESPTGLELDTFFSIALSLVVTLEQVHARHVIHKDIKPGNILIDPQTLNIKLSDFGIASLLSSETQSLSSVQRMQGTLAYMSPEQTGRMNQPLDYRSDFYSLGVTFYEMLTGRLPFETNDAIEMVHCHIAKVPLSPQELKPSVPEALANIVLKLLAKTAAGRYQSTHGLRADLEECRAQWQAKASIEVFALGKYDRSGQLRISTSLYGRENEVRILMDAFELAATGERALVTVSGFSGIGKTSIVHEIHKPITQRRGFFLSGKFDQFRRDVPYASLIQAFSELIRQILTENEEQLARFREQLRAALGANGQLLIEVIPELELVIGPQPAVPVLVTQETFTRFNSVLQQFVRVWTQVDHPLVLFLDDLQWADDASLKFLQTLMSDEQSHYLLVVGAYRDNEVSPSHPLLLTLDEIRKNGLPIQEINLQPLEKAHVCQLLQDTLHLERVEVESLAELLLHRTNGNPFFLSQLLKAWHEAKLIYCEDGEWRWDLKAIEQANLSGNVVELMAAKIQRLPPETQDILKWAACIGNRFDSRTLAMVREQSVLHIAANLWDTLREGLIIPIEGNYQTLHLLNEEQGSESVVHYKFLHDRVQQAAYSLVGESERPQLHEKIGRLMLQHASEAEREDKLFEIVSHWNQARALITSDAEKHQLTLLNLQAGLKAKASAAHQAARYFFALGQEVAPASLWQDDYETAFQLTRERSECEYLEGNFEEAEIQFELALSRAKDALDRATIEKIRVQFYEIRNNYERALEVGLEGLADLGLRLPSRPNQMAIMRVLVSIRRRQKGRVIARLSELPRMTDERRLAQLQLLEVLSPAAYLCGQQNLFLLATLQVVNISLRYGHASPSSPGYTGYGMILGLAFGNYKEGFEFGEMAVRLSQQFDSIDGRARTLFVFAAYLICWRLPLAETQAPLTEAYRLSVEAGNPIFAGYSIFQLTATLLVRGVELEKVEAEIARYLPYLAGFQGSDQWIMMKMIRQLVRNLQGGTRARLSLDSEDFDEAKVRADVKNGVYGETSQCWYFLIKTRQHYLWGDYAGALEMARAAEPILKVLIGTAPVPDQYFFHSLTLTALYPQASPKERKTYGRQLKKLQAQMKKWAKNCPTNFEHKWLLVNAEIARVNGLADAGALYDAAIESAREASFPQNEALANELATRFYGANKRPQVAQVYFKAATYLYAKWGARDKVTALEEEFPELHRELMLGRQIAAPDLKRTTNPTSDEKMSALDLATVVKAAQALSGEIGWQPLLQKLLRFALENAGATRGALILRHDGQFTIEAIGSSGENEISLPAIALETSAEVLPLSLVQYVARTRENVVLTDASHLGLFTADTYIAEHQSKSVLCAPIMHQSKLDGLIYLENDLATGAFTADHLEVLGVLSAQAAISLQNAQLYGRLEEYSRTLKQRVEERTNELSRKNEQLEQTLSELQAMQNRVIVQEKMASLGALTAGIAHEIKNPLNFVNNFAALSIDLTDELADELAKMADLDKATREYIDEILGDLKGNAQKINEHGKRADSIVRNMLLHSRGQASAPEATDLNALVCEAVQLAYHGQRAKDVSFNVTIEESYGEMVENIKILPQEISRVILNLVNNACYAVHEKAKRQGTDFSPTIRITTENCGKNVEVRVADNGEGIPQSVLEKIFTPFFTTKPTGEGTGLGLSMSYDIVVQQHGGDLSVQSTLGQGTEFVVSLPLN